jgi:hypothetical protein
MIWPNTFTALETQQDRGKDRYGVPLRCQSLGTSGYQLPCFEGGGHAHTPEGPERTCKRPAVTPRNLL